MARIEAVVTQELKDKLQTIATTDNRSITKELIQLIEDRYNLIKWNEKS